MADRLGSNVEHDYICCVFLFTEQMRSSLFVPFRGQTSGQKKGEITMGYKTDIEIAQEAKMLHIREVAEKLGIAEDELELYGKYKAKLSDELIERVKDEPDGKLILVTAINPTPAGEGKTTISVGLGEAFGQLGKKAVIALREPSLGPCFGIKGGAAGGGQAG